VLHGGCELVIELGDYKAMSWLKVFFDLDEIVVPPKAGGYKTRKALYDAIRRALTGPLPRENVDKFANCRANCPEETENFLSIYAGGAPWMGLPATEPLWTTAEIRRMGVTDFYMDQACDGRAPASLFLSRRRSKTRAARAGIYVKEGTEVTKDRVTFECAYCS
jgi:hypothetical protein